MKKIELFFILSIVLISLYSCTRINQPTDEINQDSTIYKLSTNNNNGISLGILDIHFSGHKDPQDRPPRRCVGDDDRLCWQWFPMLSYWINGQNIYSVFDESVLAMYRFNRTTKNMTISFDIPSDEEVGLQRDFFDEHLQFGCWQISHDIYIDHPNDLLRLGESRCMYIPANFYAVYSGDYTTIKGNCNTCEEYGEFGLDISLPTYYDYPFYVYIAQNQIGLLENVASCYSPFVVIGIVEESTTGTLYIRISPDFNNEENVYQMLEYLDSSPVHEPCIITQPEITELFGGDTVKVAAEIYGYTSDDTDIILMVSCENSL